MKTVISCLTENQAVSAIFAVANATKNWGVTPEIVIATTRETAMGIKAVVLGGQDPILARMTLDYPEFEFDFADKPVQHWGLDGIYTKQESMAAIVGAVELMDGATDLVLAGGLFDAYLQYVTGKGDGRRLWRLAVSRDFAGNEAFWYPTPRSTIIRRQDAPGWLDACEAKVELIGFDPYLKFPPL